MPLTHKGEEIKSSMEKEYGAKKGEEVFYASKNKGTISGVDSLLSAGDVPVAPYYGAPALDPTSTSTIQAQPSSSVPEQPSGMREPIDTFAELGRMAEQQDAWTRMTGNRDFSGDDQSRMGALPREISHKQMTRMAEGFSYNQGLGGDPYGKK